MNRKKETNPKCYKCGKPCEYNAWQFCPFCGAKLADHELPKKTRRRRNNKGDGTAFYNKNKNMWEARLKGKYLGRYHTEREAWDAVDIEIRRKKEISNNPMKKYTLEEIYELWLEEYTSRATDTSVKDDRKLNMSSVKDMVNAWKYFPNNLRKTPIIDLTASKLNEALLNAQSQNRSTAVFQKVKTLCHHLCNYALGENLINVDYASKLTLPDEKKDAKTVEPKCKFTSEELEVMWNNCSADDVKSVLIMCYMGWRPTELCNLKVSNVNFEDNTITGGIKTDAGKNRKVPIPKRLLPLVKELCAKNETFLLQTNPGKANAPIDRSNYSRDWFFPAMHRIEILKDEVDDSGKVIRRDHHVKPSSGRKNCASMYRSAGVPDWIIVKIMGHVKIDTTDTYYVQADLQDLRSAVNMIDYNDGIKFAEKNGK